jgi:acyl transferase domain-containing protein
MSEKASPEFRDDVVALFPGQGSLRGGAGVEWQSPRFWEILARVSDAARLDVAKLLIGSTDDDVVRTDRAQIATFALSIVGYFDLLECGIRPRYLLGHSLGEFSALVASGLLTIEDGARLIGVRGAAMARAAAATEGSMLALMGGDEGAREALEGLEGVWVANINGPGQIVVSGTRAGAPAPWWGGGVARRRSRLAGRSTRHSWRRPKTNSTRHSRASSGVRLTRSSSRTSTPRCTCRPTGGEISCRDS